MKKPNVLFMCVHNSARSQMAAAFLNRICPKHFEPLYTVTGRNRKRRKSFIRFVRSRAGQRVLAEQGFVPLVGQRVWAPEY